MEEPLSLPPPTSGRFKWRVTILGGVGVALVAGVWLGREPLQREISRRATLANAAPTPELVEEMIDQAVDPQAALLAAWRSGQIVHRQVAIGRLGRVFSAEQPLPAEVDALLMSAALDPDMNVRELALGTLRDRRHPALPALAAEQLRDADQHVRVLGLNHVPDSHGHIGDHAAVEEQDHGDGHHDDHERNAAALKRVREKVVRVAKARGLNYPILLDEQNEVGGRFNGGELPTTVIVDAQGNVRRRFVGARSLPVFEAMIREASQP